MSVTKSFTLRPCPVEFTVTVLLERDAEVIALLVITGVDSKDVCVPRKISQTLLVAVKMISSAVSEFGSLNTPEPKTSFAPSSFSVKFNLVMADPTGNASEVAEVANDLLSPVCAKVSCLFANETDTNVLAPFGSVEAKSVSPSINIA